MKNACGGAAKMMRFSGKTVYKGIQMGPVLVLKGNDSQVKRDKIQDADAEVERVGHAVEKRSSS